VKGDHVADSELETLRNQVSDIQETLERHKASANRLRRLCTLLTIFLAVAAVGFVAASIWFDAKASPTAHQFAQLMGYQLLFASLPLSLLTQALRIPANSP
jgi:hypothetical protein